MWAACSSCRAEGDIELAPHPGPGFLRCCECGAVLDTVDVSAWHLELELAAWTNDRLHVEGKLGSRKQAATQTDVAIDIEGRGAELAACLVLCPRALPWWLEALEHASPNRGRDLPPEWTGLDKPVEVKQTRYRSATKGFLLLRPPRGTPGPMSGDYVDDSYYVLLCGHPFRYGLAGWTDRAGFLTDCVCNPVPFGLVNGTAGASIGRSCERWRNWPRSWMDRTPRETENASRLV
jgi:hypothetical protein